METQIFNENYVLFDSTATTQIAALNEIVEIAVKNNIVDNKELLLNALLKRENEISTGLEDGFAIPHARIKEIKKISVIFVKFKNSIDWKSLDGQPVKIAIALLVPASEQESSHLELLSSIGEDNIIKNIFNYMPTVFDDFDIDVSLVKAVLTSEIKADEAMNYVYGSDSRTYNKDMLVVNVKTTLKMGNITSDITIDEQLALNISYV
ncbi:PTS sugar transporter subunit IIA [Spiroplasma sp. SV19]|uniref:PTS sugar transporter subunit IIA n=1 Tax=Spiroplasma sp. SV19 TaxID=2570468 RepID=UPI0024B78A9F|nr:PTS sugar transporter subunit IIA [Spiroplasma sp. SV19]WHQ37481.1 hypothetical protein E7Y35_06515 [Spiroplasma sp. SV19]